MYNKFVKITLAITLLTLIACNKTVSVLNDSEDVKKANSLADNFYTALMRKELEPIYKICPSPEREHELKTALEFKDSLCGPIIKADVLEVNTQRTETPDSTIVQYTIETQVDYEKKSTTETVHFVRYNGKNNLESYRYRLISK